MVNESKGPFDMALCVGSFFSIGEDNNEDANLVYIAKEFNVAIEIYCLGPICEYQRKFYKPLYKEDIIGVPPLEEGYELAANVTYLGKKGQLILF